MLYWILGGIGIAVSGLIALFFRRKPPPLVQGVTKQEAQEQKKDLADKAGEARKGIIAQVSRDLKKLRDKFGIEK